MKDELNSYKITNPDGASKEKYGDKKISYSNDDPRFIKENILNKQKETSKTSETFDLERKTSRRTFAREKARSDPASSAGASANRSSGQTQNATSAIGKLATSTTAVGGSIGAAAGVVASTVVTAVMMVAVFISTLSIDLSLVMSDMYQLVFKVEMQGVQEEDFAVPMVAVLDGSDGSHTEQPVFIDSTFLTFSDLTPNTEYVVRIKNDEKVFVEKSFFTPSQSANRGTLSARKEGEDVVVSVRDVAVGGDGFYTVTAKDERGGQLFVADEAQKDKDFRFAVGSSQNVYVTLSVGGTVCAMAQVGIEPELPTPEYDLNDYAWTWSPDKKAQISFKEIHDGESLTVAAEIKSEIVLPTCEDPGEVVYTATVVYNERTYTDAKSELVRPYGHNYSPVFSWDGTEATGRLVCSRNETHVIEPEVTVTSERFEPTCTEDAYTVYTAAMQYEGETYRDSKTVVETSTALGHRYDSPIFAWKEGEIVYDGILEMDIPQYTATATFICTVDNTHTVTIDVEEIGREGAGPGCEEDGWVTFYATVLFNDIEYCDEYEVIIPAIGHDYQPVFSWDGTEAIGCLVCSRNETHVIEPEVMMSSERSEPTCTEDAYTVYTAVMQYEGETYRDNKTIVEEGTAHGHSYDVTGRWVENNDGSYSVTAIITCEYDCSLYAEVEVPQSSISSDEIEVATYEHGGRILYHAGFEYDYNVYNIDHTVYTPPLS